MSFTFVVYNFTQFNTARLYHRIMFAATERQIKIHEITKKNHTDALIHRQIMNKFKIKIGGLV